MQTSDAMTQILIGQSFGNQEVEIISWLVLTLAAS
jgi:hypothetical protein